MYSSPKNRTSDTGGSLHTVGSISTHEHAIRMVCIHETYKLHWTLFVIGFELCFMITYYSTIQCLKVRYDNTALDYIQFKKFDDIVLHKNNIIYVCCL